MNARSKVNFVCTILLIILALSMATNTSLATTVNTHLSDSTQAKIWTDKPDYHPGSVVTIYGSGFTPYAAVKVQVTQVNDQVTTTCKATADSQGNFTTTYQICPQGAPFFKVSATDGANTAKTTFTDSGESITVSDAGNTYGYVGDTCTVTGSNWISEEYLTGQIFFGSNPVAVTDFTVASDGTFSTSFTVPTLAPGAYTVEAIVYSPGNPSTTAQFTILSSASYFTVSASSPQTSGSTFDVTVTAKNSDGNTATDYTGTFSLSCSDPAAVLPDGPFTLTGGTGTFEVSLINAGSQTITATDTVDSSITGSTSVVVPFSATINGKSNGPLGSTIPFSFWSGLSTSDSYYISFEYTLDSSPVTVNIPVTVNDGALTATYTLPTNPPIQGGQYTFQLVDTTHSATYDAYFAVTPSITISPTYGSAGMSIQITGIGFRDSSPYNHLIVYFGGTSVASTVSSNGYPGSFVADFTVPSTFTVAGIQTVSAEDTSNDQTASTSLNVVSFTATDSSTGVPLTQGFVGDTITFSGSGFPAGLLYEIMSFDSSGPPVSDYASGTISGSGNIAASSTIYPVYEGTYSVEVLISTDGGSSYYPIAVAPFTVNPSITFDRFPSSFPYGNPLTSAPSGTEIIINGNGFSSSDNLGSDSFTVLVDGGTPHSVIVTNPGSDGTLAANFIIPPLEAGAHTITLEDTTTGDTASASFTVTSPVLSVADSITHTSGSGYVNDKLTYSCTNLLPSASGEYDLIIVGPNSYNVVLDSSCPSTNSGGSINGATSSSSPAPTTGGLYTVELIDGWDEIVIASAWYTINPSLTASVGVSCPGEQVTVYGEGFAVSNPTTNSLTAKLAGSQDSYTVTLGSLSSSGKGDFSATFMIPNIPVGTYSLIITDASHDSPTPLSFTIRNPIVVVASPAQVTAGVPFQVTVTMLDPSGNPVAGYTGTIHFTSTDTGAQTVLPADYTFTAADQGSHVFIVTLTTATNVAGLSPQTLTVTDTVISAIVGTASGITVEPGPATHFQIETGMESNHDPDTAVAGQQLEQVNHGSLGSGDILVKALDAYGNLATGYTGTVYFASTDPQAALPADSTLPGILSTSAEGLFTVTLFTAGLQTITVTDTTNGAITGSSNPILVYPAALDYITVTPSGTVAAGQPESFTVNACDQYGNLIGDVTSSSIYVMGITQVNNTVTEDKAGLYSVTAYFGANAATANWTVTPAALNQINVNGPSSVTAGQPANFTATGVDQYGNAVSITPTWTINGASTPTSKVTESIAGSYIITATVGSISGKATLNVTPGSLNSITIGVSSPSTTAGNPEALTAEGYDAYGNSLGSQTVTFTVNGASVTGSSVTETAVGAYTVSATGTVATITTATFQVTAAALNHLTITPTASSITAGNSQTYAVNSYDAYNNLIASGVSATFKVNGTGITGSSVAETQAGTYTVEADFNGKSVTTTLTVTHATAVSSVNITPAASAVTAGQPQTFKATAQDKYGNTWDVTSQTTWSVSSSAAGQWASNVYTSADAGTWTITGTYASTAYTTTLTVNPAAVSKFTVTAASTAQAGASFSITITALDAFGNTASFSGNVALTASSGTVSPSTATLTSGTWAGAVTLSASGLIAVTATDTNGQTGTSNSITVSPAPTPTPTPTPSPTPTPNEYSGTIIATDTNTGSTVYLPITGNITSTQITNATITTNQTAFTTTISFTVTGQTGTVGYCNLTIAKSEVPYGIPIEVYIDGKPAADQSFTQDANNYYVWFETHFSTHQVTIEFTGKPTPTPTSSTINQPTSTPTSLWLVITAVVAVAAVILIAVTVALRRGKQKIRKA